MSRELSIGVVTGFIILIWMTLVYAFKWEEASWGTYLSSICLMILAGGIYVAILRKRDRNRGGIISLKEAWIAGVAVSFIVGLMNGAFMSVYVTWVNPGVVDEVVKTATDFYKSQKYSQQQIDEGIASVRAMYSGF